VLPVVVELAPEVPPEAVVEELELELLPQAATTSAMQATPAPTLIDFRLNTLTIETLLVSVTIARAPVPIT